jgi:hypothetical protein
MKGTGGSTRAVRTVLRFGIAALLLATAAGKLLSIPGFARVLATYRALPEPSLLPIAAAISLAELLLAAWLFSGRRLRAAALASAGVHLAYAAAAAATLARGIDVPNCGCFGVFLARPLTYATFFEDAGLAVASLALAATSGSSA